jgi:hypothetical protein
LAPTLRITPTESVTIRERDQDRTLDAGDRIDFPVAPSTRCGIPAAPSPGAAKPEPVVRGLLAVLAPLGRPRGYGPT